MQSLFLRCFLNTDTKCQNCAWPQRTKPDCSPTFNTNLLPSPRPTWKQPLPVTALFLFSPRSRQSFAMTRTPPSGLHSHSILNPTTPARQPRSSSCGSETAWWKPDGGGGGRICITCPEPIFRFRHVRVQQPFLSGWVLYVLSSLLLHLSPQLPLPCSQREDMSVPGPPSPDGVLTGPPDGMEYGEPTSGTCCGAWRAAGIRVGGSPGPLRGNWWFSDAAARRLGPQRGSGELRRPAAQLNGWGVGVRRGSVVWGAVDGEVILNLYVCSNALFVVH